MLDYFEELDRKCQDDEFVKRTFRELALKKLEDEFWDARTMYTSGASWPLALLRKIEDYLARRSARMDDQRVFHELLGKLLLVAEHRSWVDEVFQIVKERWAVQRSCVDPHHRPQSVNSAKANLRRDT
ncbi:unnamed protein product [marine sediment metagenome]|uniref:Uncharacterized protein n=1 Tax=marine sediment metagenome TaxID=412755 RepID=X1AEH5_9ZZZZ